MEGRKRKEKRKGEKRMKGREGGEKRHLKHQVLDLTLVTLTPCSTLQYFGSKKPAVSGYI